MRARAHHYQTSRPPYLETLSELNRGRLQFQYQCPAKIEGSFTSTRIPGGRNKIEEGFPILVEVQSPFHPPTKGLNCDHERA
jgi:hypothetical protein